MNKLLLTTFLLLSTFWGYSQDSLKRYNGCEIKVDNKWVKQEQGTPPINQDTLSFDQTIISTIVYPSQALKMGVEGDVIFSIDINAAGEVTMYSIVKDIGAGTNVATAMAIDKLPAKWTPATFHNIQVESRVNVLVKFHLGPIDSFGDTGAYYKSYLVIATGGGKFKAMNAQNFIKPKKKKSKE